MANQKHDLPQTRKIFKLAGKVTGVSSKNFYQESNTKNGRGMRIISFGVETSTTNKVFVQIMGIEQDSVYFTKKNEDGTYETEKVSWYDRNKFSKEGFKLAGSINIGLNKAIDASGKEVNANQHLAPYDACLAIKDKLKDGMNVFVRGSKGVSTYVDKDGNNRVSVKLNAEQISLRADQDAETPVEEEIDYTDLGKIPATFEDVVIYEDIKTDEDSTPDNFSATLTTINVAYDTICELDYKIHSPSLAKIMKERLKPYSSLTIAGNIVNCAVVTEDEEDDGWGISDSSKKITDYKREYNVLRVDPKTISTSTYSKDKIEKAKTALLEFNNQKAESAPASTTIKSSDVPEEDDWGI